MVSATRPAVIESQRLRKMLARLPKSSLLSCFAALLYGKANVLAKGDSEKVNAMTAEELLALGWGAFTQDEWDRMGLSKELRK